MENLRKRKFSDIETYDRKISEFLRPCLAIKNWPRKVRRSCHYGNWLAAFKIFCHQAKCKNACNSLSLIWLNFVYIIRNRRTVNFVFSYQIYCTSIYCMDAPMWIWILKFELFRHYSSHYWSFHLFSFSPPSKLPSFA